MTGQQQRITPEEFAGEVELALPKSTQKERNLLLEHLRAWVVVFYEGEVPTDIEHRLESLEVRWRS
jgi:hypothetical protein